MNLADLLLLTMMRHKHFRATAYGRSSERTDNFPADIFTVPHSKARPVRCPYCVS